MKSKNILDGVSVIIPAYNAAKTLGECIESATKQKWLGGYEIIVVNDGSKDRTEEIALSFPDVQVVNTANGGASKATNIGINRARYGTVVSLDADAVLADDWLEKIMPSFADQSVAAVGGYAITGNRSIIGKLMGYDVELRLDRIPADTDHLYTMNTAYRRQVLLDIGLFDAEMKIAYDADISRRLKAAGYNLVFKKEAKCTHYWRDDLRDFLRQQYKYAYYHLEQIRKFGKPKNQMVNWWMITQVPLTLLILAGATLGILASPLALLGLALLPLMHLPEAIMLLFKKKDICSLVLPLQFTLRNLVWVQASVVWGMGDILQTFHKSLKSWRRE